MSARRRSIASMASGAAGPLLALSLGLAQLAARPATAAEPFYLSRERDGIAAYDRKEYAAAARALRVACFGLLDEPAPLADCLVRLAAAQGAAGDADGFQNTFRRLAEVEERFAVYRKLTLSPDLRNAFEDRAAATIPPSTLAAVPTFAAFASRRAEALLAALPPKERRRQLEARLVKEPRDPVANRMLAELDFDEGRTAQAVTRAELAVTLAPQEPRALCLRGLTRAWVRRCKDAVADLEPCPRSVRDPRYATALLGCWVELGEWREAQGVIDALPGELKDERKIAALITRVQQHPPAKPAVPAASAQTAPSHPAKIPSAIKSDRASASSAPAVIAPAAATAATAASPPANPPPAAAAPPLTSAERGSLEKARELLGSAQARDVKQAYDLARAVADSRLDSREAQLLAGEAAYRSSRWRDAAAYLKRGGQPSDDRPELLFYLAVSLFESGDGQGAAAALKRALPNLQRTPYVESTMQRILGPGKGR